MTDWATCQDPPAPAWGACETPPATQWESCAPETGCVLQEHLWEEFADRADATTPTTGAVTWGDCEVTIEGQDDGGIGDCQGPCWGNTGIRREAWATGTLSFDYSYSTNDTGGSQADPFIISAGHAPATDIFAVYDATTSGSGSGSIEVTAGQDIYGYIRTEDNNFGALTATVTNMEIT